MTNSTEAPMASAIDDVKLLNCPFCGVMPFADVQNGQSGPLGQVQFVWCEKCDGCGPERLSKAEAIAAWNRRASPAPSQHTGWSDEAVDDVAAALWLAEVTDAGVPRSAIEARTRTAFDDESESTKSRWRKFARAALSAASAIAPATGFEVKVRPVNVIDGRTLVHVEDDETGEGLFSVPIKHRAYADLLWEVTHISPSVAKESGEPS